MKKLLGTLMFVLMLSLNVAGVVYADEISELNSETNIIEAQTMLFEADTARTKAETAEIRAEQAEFAGDFDLAEQYRNEAAAHRSTAESYEKAAGLYSDVEGANVEAVRRSNEDGGVSSNIQQNTEILENSPELQGIQSDIDRTSAVLDAVENGIAAGERSLEQAEKDVVAARQAVAEAESAVALAEGTGDFQPENDLEDAKKALEDAENRAFDLVEGLDSLKAAREAGLAEIERLQGERKRALDEYYANRISVLPKTNTSVKDCKVLMNQVEMNVADVKKRFENREDEYISDVLGCGIKTGDIKLWMVPYYVRFILEFILQIGGLVAVGGIVYGGYLYLFAGVSDDKDRGKKAILYAAAGIVIMMVAWAFVNIVVSVLTA